jgi:predicted aspartyl protease
MAMKSKVTIMGREVVAIIDSGAAVSLISDSLRRDLGIQISEGSNVRFVLANGDKVASLGKVELEIENGNGEGIQVKVQVIDSSEKDLILGNDMLGERNGIIDYQEGMLTINNNGGVIRIPVEYYRDNQRINYEEIEEG